MKKLKYLLFISLLFITFETKVNAAASLSISASQVYAGGSFTTTVNLSGVAAWEVHVSASGPVSGCSINAADATDNALNGSKSYSATCITTGTGTVTVSLSGNATTESDSKSALSGTKTVSVIDKPSTNNASNNTSSNTTTNKTNNTTTKKEEKKKSSNCYLKEYRIDGYEISPTFEKDKYDYTLTVPNNVKEVLIYVTRDDDSSKVSGDDGTVEIKEGENKFTTVVTAENGDKKEYNITITVDSKPITVKVDNKDFSIIKNKEELPELKIEHEDLELTIDEQTVPAYRIDSINYVLVGLTDDKGNKSLYKFDSYKDDEKPFEYKKFEYIIMNDNLMVLLDFPKSKIPTGYKLFKETINETKYSVYKNSSKSNYGLIYGMNVKTGKKNIYKYELTENTIQIYDNSDKNSSKEEEIIKLVYIMGGAIAFLLLLVTIGFTRKPKMKKEIEE